MPALNYNDLTAIRRRPIGRTWKLYVYQPTVVWTATVGGAPDRGDRTLTTATATGSLAFVEEHSTIWVTDSAGNRKDYPSKVRFRSYVGNVITIADNNIDWAAGDLLTGLRHWEIWPKHVYVDQDTEAQYKDRDIAWSSDADTQRPKANAGPAAIGMLVGGQCDLTFNDIGSFNPPLGGAPASYQWIAWDGFPAVIAGAENSPTVTYRYSTAGYYTVSLEVDDGAGNTGIMYVPVIVDDGTYGLEVSNLNYNWDQMGWTLNLDNLGLDYDDSYFYDGAPVFLVAGETYNTAPSAFVSGRHNLRWSGWLIEDRVQRSYSDRQLTYKAVSSGHIMRSIPAYPTHIEEQAAPSSWYEITDANIDGIVHYLLEWHSTVNVCCNVLPTGEWNSRQRVGEEPTSDDLLTQVDYVLSGCVANMRCDRQGILRSMRGEWYLSVAERAGRATVMTLSPFDFREVRYGPSPHRATVRQVRGDGVSGASVPYYSGAPGPAPLDGGRPEELKKLSPNSQAECNQWTAAHLSIRNWSIPLILSMSGEYDVVDPARGEFVAGTLTTYDSRLADGSYSVNGVKVNIDQRNSTATSEWELIPNPMAYGAYGAQTIIIPIEPERPEPEELPENDYEPPPVPPEPLPSEVFFAAKGSVTNGVYYTDTFDMATVIWEKLETDGDWPVDGYLRCFGVAPEPDHLDFQYALTETNRNIIMRDATEPVPTWTEILSTADDIQSGTFYCSDDAYITWMKVDKATGTIWASVHDITTAGDTTTGCWVMEGVNSAGVVVWTKHTVFETSDVAARVDKDGNIDCYDDYIVVGYQSRNPATAGLWKLIGYSQNGGTTWNISDDVGSAALEEIRVWLHPASYSSGCYRRVNPGLGALGQIYWYPYGGVSAQLETDNLWHQSQDHAEVFWGDPSDSNYMRKLDELGHLLITDDDWSTHTDKGLLDIDGGAGTHQLTSISDIDMTALIMGTEDADVTFTDSIYYTVDEDDLTPTGKSGDMAHASPFTNSIPFNCGGPCYGMGIRVIEFVA